jgi:hypothetical protein
MKELQWSALPVDGKCLVFLCPESTVYKQRLDMKELQASALHYL